MSRYLKCILHELYSSQKILYVNLSINRLWIDKLNQDILAVKIKLWLVALYHYHEFNDIYYLYIEYKEEEYVETILEQKV